MDAALDAAASVLSDFESTRRVSPPAPKPTARAAPPPDVVVQFEEVELPRRG